MAGAGTAKIIDGRALAAELRRQVTEAAAELRSRHGVAVGLATVLVGDDPASHVYVASKDRACEIAGLSSVARRLPADISEGALAAEISALGRDERVDGILVQLPLPPQIDPHRIIGAIDPMKDVDGFHPVNVGRLWSGLPALVPCTPQGCLRLLRSVHGDLAGMRAVVLGRSNIVGKPVAALLLAAHCTVTLVHSRSRDAAALCRDADLLIAAVGQPLWVKGEWIKPGATVIDVGINRIATASAAKLVGDVDFAAASTIAGAITPVPGGVGPMTIACLLRNTVLAACRRRGLSDPLP
ncbi:MAG: bifunctional methylenetetrahydrofolate dehydrogenase/methenyltetrahydrofolate cyclohydrolase FolD [Alphaproteobacteria bacterium]|nr:bifunctional methylenetetrahydrofolate dehydrogenase/methenyltetrahydrofolate cyclohydrolase FolD [Alphaproteobacteria bacterium]